MDAEHSVAGRVEKWTEEEKSYSLGREYSKNYEKIRSFIRPTFFGACYTIPEYQEYFGINPNTVNNKGRKTLEFVFTEPVTLNRKQGNNFLLDLFSDEGKALYRTFELIGPTRQQLYHEVEIRDLLKNTGEGLTLAELSQAVSERAMDRLTYLLENRDEKQSDVFYDTLKYFFSENSSIGRRDSLETVLERMKSQGYAESVGDRYRLTENLLEDISTETLKKLVQFMEFFKGVSPFAVPAYRFIQTAKETLGYREGDFSEKTPSPFIFQYDFFYRMIDEEVLLKLYEGWLKKEAVSFTYLPEKQYRENRTGLVKWNDPSLKIEERQITAVPFGVTHTDLYGRRYLFAYVLDSAQKEIAKNREALFRLDRISNVEEIHSLKTGAIRKKEGAKKGKENPAPSVDAVYKQAPRLKKRLNKSWNSSLSGKEQYRYFETEIVFPETFRETSPEEAAFFNRMKNRRDTYETLGDHRYRLFGIFQTEREAKKWAEGFQGVCTDPKPVSYGEILFDFSQDSERIQAFLERFPKEQTASLGRNRYLYRNYVSDAQTLLQDMAPFVSSVDFLELDEYVHKYDYEITLRFSEEACEKHAFLNQRKEEALFAKETQRIASFEKGFLMRYESPEDGVHQLKLSHAFQTQKDLEQWILSLRKKIGQEDEVEITFEIKSPFLEVIFDFKECPSRKERFFREGKNGMIRKLGGDRYLFRIYLADQKEILPWLYSFGKAVAEIDCRETIRKKELESCAGSVLKNYGIF